MAACYNKENSHNGAVPFMTEDSMKNDIDDLLNQVFGRRTHPTGDSAPLPELHAQPSSKSAARKKKPSIDAVQQNVLNMQKELDARAARQRREIEALNQNALADISRIEQELDTPEVQALAKPPRTAPPKVGLEGFEGLSPALKECVFGQDEYLRQLCIALKRPYVMGHQGQDARGAIFISGPSATGRRLALRRAAKFLSEKGVFACADIAWLDLSLYPTASEEKLFLQDLYMALAGSCDLVCFLHSGQCHPGFLTVLSNLVQKGFHPLASRYVLQNGRLVDAGASLVKDAVSQLTPQGKYLIFLEEDSLEKLAGRFGSPFVTSLNDLCQTIPLSEKARLEVAGQECRLLTERAQTALGFSVTVQNTILDRAAQAGSEPGAQPILDFFDRLYRALAQYKLEHAVDDKLSVQVKDADGRTVLDFGGTVLALDELLPAGYQGDLDAVKAELARIVGLSDVKEYVLSLEENYRVQQRRKEQGLKTSAVSMHMIFTGNPGTGKTTIARLISKYLKAIGVLSGGQLVEVTRADLVGKYVGHTAPLTTQVMNSALGGVLFIDEAYSLYRGKDDSFGLECIDTLVKGMEDHRDDLVVILAGYTREMNDFLSSNSGLKSRFPNIIEFPDYTGEELLAIARLQAQAKGYVLDSGCDAPLQIYFNAVQMTRAREAGNGRLARNKVEEAILAQSRRISRDPDADLSALLPEDFDLSDIND